MKKFSCLALLALVVAVATVFLSKAPVAEAATCSAVALSPCLSAITGGTAPSSVCCSRLREQRPCLCGYLKDPNLRQYVNSPNAKKVASVCGVSYPKCS
ncbi:hypothetical protein L484_027077 [Morus notabilis]|uniref:Bifunctional inhibitor/plant lipid transfer protein/seed storage helical domain-containing protein n=1 Tax=Morus notabilis TaxID=981085 RepID=W9S0V3_9ROSA|nr:non-specific lipid-transfer protein 2 [Morus notabilis]EXC20523.1 hypothetical protein L484_027077 [Morus notabilis]